MSGIKRKAVILTIIENDDNSEMRELNNLDGKKNEEEITRYHVRDWIGILGVDPNIIADHLVQFTHLAGVGEVKSSFLQLIWLLCSWCLKFKAALTLTLDLKWLHVCSVDLGLIPRATKAFRGGSFSKVVQDLSLFDVILEGIFSKVDTSLTFPLIES
ncbi:hypothetical protein MTR_0014s0110 [Medicago truncatula]|uniref:Uncharacterized protein n=1 Tax=Medicago truncatula TaxID=3880 RepID=A0A072TIT1_MEDTR|nr:hypothetical protein MTR_0014s0110 [Medicago truncatula]